jgi:hypothetical protein
MSSPRGRGGFQIMKIDDRGGGGLVNDDITKNCHIFGRFLGISSDIKKKFENFLRINIFRRTIFK